MQRDTLTVPVQKFTEGTVSAAQDLVAVEEPLEIRLAGRNVAITMRTPGHDRELAVGFLYTEGILQNRAQISSLNISEHNIADIVPAAGIAIDTTRLERHFYMSSSCGVCGKASIQAIEAVGCPMLARDRPRVHPALLADLPRRVRERQAVFERTGGLHAAALFEPSGRLVDLREDVGRHNALDKLIGAAFLSESLPLSEYILVLSGRVSFELAQKAAMAGIAMVAAVGAPSSLAVEVALRFGMTLAGFVRDERFNLYSGEWRLG